MDIFVLSPHRDDAAFSLAIFIRYWLTAGHRVNLLNIFTRSRYAPYSDVETVHVNDRLSYVSALRKWEDEQFLKQIPGANLIDLNLKDAPIRLRCTISQVCHIAVDPADPAIPKIQKAITKFASGAGASVAIVIPLALGRHVDHSTVRDAVMPLIVDLPTAFYEDLPYAMREGAERDLINFQEILRNETGALLNPMVCHGSHSHSEEFKRDVSLLYSSQITNDVAEAIATFSRRYQGGERIWVNESWRTMALREKLSHSPNEAQTEPNFI